MLDLAYKYKEQITKSFLDTWYDDKYKYYFLDKHYVYEVPDNDERGRYFASINSKGELIGYISYSTDESTSSAYNFGAINFTNDKVTFGCDLVKAIDDIFMKFNMNRIDFCVVIGNPIEKNYDRLVLKYGGRIVGIRKQITKTYDGILRDDKIYEILREDYIKAKENMKHERS